MTSDRRREAGRRAHQGAPAPQMEILPPLREWAHANDCRLWEQTAAQHGPLIAITISSGDDWWELDDLARDVAGALQDRPPAERGLWVRHGRFTVIPREHLDGIVAALAGVGSLSRLTVRAVPDAANCTHASCRRRRGQPPLPAQAITRPSSVRPASSLVPTLSLAEVMDQHRLLNINGMGVSDARNKTMRQRHEEIATGRDELASREDRVMETAAWLADNIGPVQTPNYSSYRLKHLLERSPGGWYVTNGEFFAAALIVGYPHRNDGPDMLFGMSALDIRRLDGEAR
ncbi:hypothetical protein [Catellatospora chokoriensis]|uniref:Uncharacterized protein n=1 Tax=Catellatospora chokoriensis TaxID=310353 RepID=A0A8J3KBU7_9ACTN|nr:hypothetical protein [Catellatospora chokoriensis]GIF93888.1 hypothetical protein Cch02nite_73320 [Catellatospora chokoriensis]